MRFKLIGLIAMAVVLSGCSKTHEQTASAPSVPSPIATSNPVQAVKTDTPTSVSKPALTAQIENVSMYPVPNNRKDLAVSVVVSLRNSGLPSIANRWNLEVVSSDPAIPSGLEPVHVSGVVDLPGAGNKKVDLGKEDLTVKTADSPVGNRTVEGVLTFVLPQTSEKELVSNNASFILHFRDSTGAAYQSPKIVVGRKKSELANKK